VPIFYNASLSDLKALVLSINGLVLPGGAVRLKDNPQFYNAAAYLYQLAMEVCAIDCMRSGEARRLAHSLGEQKRILFSNHWSLSGL
jgi:hypothetical protein